MRCHCLEIQNRGVAGWVRTCETGESRSSRRSTRVQEEVHEIQKFQEKHEIQEFEEEHMIQCEMMWMVTRQWCRGCQIFLLNPVRDRSLNMN